MKYIITGSIGNISKPLSEKLIGAGHEVTIISSHEGKIKEIEALGGIHAIGSVNDLEFLKKTFRGADAIYTMVPPNHHPKDWKSEIHETGRVYYEAIKSEGIKKVVNLSSIGAHLAEGAGPVSGLFRVENEFNKLDGVDIVHLRPGYFYFNLFANLGMIKHMGIMGSNFGDNPLVMVHPRDIAEVASHFLLKPDFTGKTVQYIASDIRNGHDIAQVLGKAIGKPDLKWMVFKDEDALKGMLGAGLPEESARNYVEMGASIADGKFQEDFYLHKPALSPTKLEDFALEFEGAYSHS